LGILWEFSDHYSYGYNRANMIDTLCMEWYTLLLVERGCWSTFVYWYFTWNYQFCLINVTPLLSVPGCLSGNGNYFQFYFVKFLVGISLVTDSLPVKHVVPILQLTVNCWLPDPQSTDPCTWPTLPNLQSSY